MKKILLQRDYYMSLSDYAEMQGVSKQAILQSPYEQRNLIRFGPKTMIVRLRE